MDISIEKWSYWGGDWRGSIIYENLIIKVRDSRESGSLWVKFENLEKKKKCWIDYIFMNDYLNSKGGWMDILLVFKWLEWIIYLLLLFLFLFKQLLNHFYSLDLWFIMNIESV